MKDNTFATSMATLVALAIVGFLFWYVPRYSTHSIDATQKCADIFKEKAPGYFGTAGINRFVFNKSLNSCLILNIVSDETTGAARYIVVDMISDTIDFYYDLKANESKDVTLGLSKDQALDKIRAFGFVIF